MLFISSKITIQIKRNPFSTSLGLLERSANNHCWARTEIYYFQPPVMLMAMIIRAIGGLVTCCARKRYHYVTNIILPNPWRFAYKPQKRQRKEIIYEQNQWSVMTFHTCFIKYIEIRWFNAFSLQKEWEMSSEPTEYSCSSTSCGICSLCISAGLDMRRDTLWILFGNTRTNTSPFLKVYFHLLYHFYFNVSILYPPFLNFRTEKTTNTGTQSDQIVIDKSNLRDL